MSYLDVNPMITALRSSPDAFTFKGGTLVHIPTHHQFQFDAQRRVRVYADCGCSLLQVSTEQGLALYEVFSEWRSDYWRGIEINQEFASHFAPPSSLRSWLIKLTGWLHHAALTAKRGPTENIKSYQTVPAE